MDELSALKVTMDSLDLGWDEKANFCRAIMKAVQRRVEAEAELAKWEAKRAEKAYQEGR